VTQGSSVLAASAARIERPALRQNQSYQGVSKILDGAVFLGKTALDSIGFPYSNADFALAIVQANQPLSSI
jgi:hypothetical protein